MSWSFSAIGTVAKLVEAMQAYGRGLTGECKAEFESALPHLVGLMSQNFSAEAAPDGPVLHVVASGSGYAKGHVPMGRNCCVRIDPWYEQVLV